ncbi:MAG TPA: S1 RNA-binding domain-containing protein [Acidobacteriaceae bacterium]|nr:S1 RNA-binding domain-containing protein [Acidobacteriaceae bacterium]
MSDSTPETNSTPNPEVETQTLDVTTPVEATLAAEIASIAEVPVASTPVDPKIDEQTDPLHAVVALKDAAPAEAEESFAEIFSEFQRANVRREASGQLRGTIVSITPDAVLVDIGFKIEGMLPPTAFAGHKEAPKVGDTVLVSTKGRTEDGYYALSLFRTAVPKDWTGLQKAYDEKLTIPGTVTGVVKGGLHVDVGVRAFLPASRSGARDAAEMEKLIGEEIRVRITKLDVEDEDVVIDRRVVTEEEASASRARRHAELREGDVVSGTVRSITDYGAFVDLGGVDGLLHIAEIAWNRVMKVDEILSAGQELNVKILKIDAETGKISLGLKQLTAHPWESVESAFKTGDRVRGVVTRTTDFGAFVELAPGIEGLIHLSEMSWSKRIHKATEVVKTGDVVEVVLLSIDMTARRISLGLKQALGDPWVENAAKIRPGAVVEGTVSSMTRFGAFVRVAEGVEGLVHISEIVPDRRLNHPSDVLHNGQTVQALVLDTDKEKRQMRLSIKQLIPTGLDEFLAEHAVGDLVSGRIAEIRESNAEVELGDGIFCTCTLPERKAPVEAASPAAGKVDLSAFSSMLKNKWKTGGEAQGSAANSAPEAGQLRKFRITQIDKGAKRVAIELAD